MRILVATGGAAHSIVALTFAAHLALVSGAALTVITVVKREEERPKALGILDRARLVLDPLNVRCDTLVRVGHPAEEILRESESGRYDLVVVGEKQHHSLRTRFILGSTALRVVEHSPCPAVVVKGQIGPIDHILICDSGVSDEPLIDRIAAQVPALLRGAKKITVLHVMSQIGASPNLVTNALQEDTESLIEQHTPEGSLLQRDVELLEDRGYEATPKVRLGPVVEEILAEAHEGAYSLVVIGAHRGTGWRRILLDDVAHQIIVHLDRPVLVVR